MQAIDMLDTRSPSKETQAHGGLRPNDLLQASKETVAGKQAGGIPSAQ
jgi:hypothetical protein